MEWFPQKLGTGSRLARFALAPQFVLSFEHFHFDAAQAAPAVQLQAKLGYAEALATDVLSQTQLQQPASHDDPPFVEPFAISPVLTKANHVVVATPALLLVPNVIELFFLATDAKFVDLG